MDQTSPTPERLLVLADKSGKIRAAMVNAPRGGVGGPPEVRMVPGTGDVLHEIDLPDDEAQSIAALDEYRVDGRGAEARLVKRE